MHKRKREAVTTTEEQGGIAEDSLQEKRNKRDESEDSDAEENEDDDDEEEEEEEEEEGEYEGQTHPETGLPHGRGKMSYPKSGVRFEGSWKEGDKEGLGILYFADGSTLEGNYVDGELHGPGTRYIYPDGSSIVAEYDRGEMSGHVEERDCNGDLIFKGQYEHNVRHGHGILYYDDGGSMEGEWVEGELDCDHGVYTYPDGLCQLVGKWKDGDMVAAVFQKKGGASDEDLETRLSKAVPGIDLFVFYPATETRLHSWPLQRDPYESERVTVKPSTIPGGGEGLFAIRPIPANEIATFYNGFRLTHAEVDGRDWTLNSNTLSLDSETVLDVPRSLIDTSIYAATLAHKANCQVAREMNNSKYDTVFHPRFGFIKCIRTVKPLKAGDEIFVDYDYNTEQPDWYAAELERMRTETRKEEGEGLLDNEIGENASEKDKNERSY